MKTEKKSYVEFQCRMVMVHPTFEHLDWDGGFSIKLHFCRILPFIIHPVQQRGEKNTEIIVGDNFWVTVGMPTGSCQSSSRSHLWKQVFLCGPLAKTYTHTPTRTQTHTLHFGRLSTHLFFYFLTPSSLFVFLYFTVTYFLSVMFGVFWELFCEVLWFIYLTFPLFLTCLVYLHLTMCFSTISSQKWTNNPRNESYSNTYAQDGD